MSSEAPRLTEERLEGAIAITSHLAVLCFGFGLGVVALGTAIEGATGPLMVVNPLTDVLADGVRWAYYAVGASLLLLAVGAVLHHRVESADSG